MGDVEIFLLGKMESSVRYHFYTIEILTSYRNPVDWTVSGGQFDWGGRLLKGNIGVQRFPPVGQKSILECKGKRKLDCETNKSSRDESRS